MYHMYNCVSTKDTGDVQNSSHAKDLATIKLYKFWKLKTTDKILNSLNVTWNIKNQVELGRVSNRETDKNYVKGIFCFFKN